MKNREQGFFKKINRFNIAYIYCSTVYCLQIVPQFTRRWKKDFLKRSVRGTNKE